jgi:hypothetical protein
MMKIKNCTKANGRDCYKLTGDTKSETAKIGQLFIDIWGSSFDPVVEPPRLGRSGTWCSRASRAARRDESLYGQAELREAAIAHRNAGTYKFNDIWDADADEELEHIPVSPGQRKLNELNPVSESEIVHLLSCEDFEMAYYRFPPIFFKTYDPDASVPQDEPRPWIDSGYFVEYPYYHEPGDGPGDGPFATTDEALTWVYQRFLERNSKVNYAEKFALVQPYGDGK